MGKIFSIDADVKRVISDAMDDFLVNGADGGLGKTCLLVYPPKSVRCDNCVVDPVSGRSVGRPRSGAPVPFAGGRCPLCGGEGRKHSEVTEELTLSCNWLPKKFVTPVPNVDLRIPYGLVETRGFLADAPKVLKCDHMVFNLPVAPVVRQKFKLLVEPTDRSNIVQNRFFYAVWERWNG